MSDIVVVVKTFADVANTVAGSAQTLILESHGINTTKGGGRFTRIESALAAIEGYRVKTQDGATFQRTFPDGVEPHVHAEHVGYTPMFNEDAHALLTKLFASAAAARLPVTLPNSVIFRVCKRVILPTNIPKVNGNNSFLYFYHKPSLSADVNMGLGLTKGARNCVIENLHIDYDRETEVIKLTGVWLENTNNITLRNCNITTRESHCVLVRNADNATAELTGFVAENVITCVHKSVEDAAFQNFNCDLTVAHSMDNIWKSTNAVLERKGHKGYKFIGCEAWNGRYGIGFLWVTDSVVKDCLFYKNTRSISAQNNCNNNTFENLFSGEVKSAAMHVNYGSKYNSFNNVTIKSSYAHGQGAIHFSIEAHGNKFENFDIESTHNVGMRWAIYGGVNSSDNIVRNVVFNGTLSLTGLVIESGIRGGDTHGGYGVTLSTVENANVGKWQTTPSSNNLFENVTINSPSAVRGIAIATFEQDLIGTTLRNITINGENFSKELLVSRHSGAVKGLIISNVKVKPEKSEFGDLSIYKHYSPTVV